MNRFLVVPLLISTGTFGTVFWINNTAPADPDNPPPSVSEEADGSLLTLHAAEKMVTQVFTADTSRERFLSRAAVPRPTTVVSVQFSNDASQGGPYFLGSVLLDQRKQQQRFPVVVDRFTKRILIYSGDQWHDQKTWSANRAFFR